MAIKFENEIVQSVKTLISPDARIESIKRLEGKQGFSGAQVGYYDVSYTVGESAELIRLVVKDTPLVERRVLDWLGKQGVAVPFSYSADLTTDDSTPVCMQYVGDDAKADNYTRTVAEALARIHAANLDKMAALDWLPRADGAYIAEWTIESSWRRGWQSLMAGEGFIDGYGQDWGRPKPGADFSAEFGDYTDALEAAAKAMKSAVERLWQEGDSLTLIHADLHNDHVYYNGERPYLIDWGEARYGPLYLDFPNIFSREEVMMYRQALARLGYSIPEEAFLANYEALRPYPGFKYFGVGLWNWCFGDRPHQRQHVLHFIDMIL